MQQVARCNAIDVGKTSSRVRLWVETCQKFEQALMGMVCNRDRQRLFIERLDVAADETAQQPIQAALLGLVPAQAFQFLLEVPEGPQAVMLVREPRIKIVHFSLFKKEKKLQGYTLSPGAGQMRNWHPCAAIRVVEAILRKQAMRDEIPASAINTKLASIHTPFGLDGIFTAH
jgi:hypothetical protein